MPVSNPVLDFLSSAKEQLAAGGKAGRSTGGGLPSILKQHPVVKAYRSEWRKYLDCYEGGIAFTKNSFFITELDTHELAQLEGSTAVKEYLRPHKREFSQDFDKRKRRTHYFNYCRPSIDFWVSAIFREQQSRVTDDEDILSFWENTDGRGNDIQTFMKEDVAVTGQIYGFSLVLVDMPNPPELQDVKDITVAQAREFNIFPRAKIITPLQIVNWQINSNGDFDIICYREQFASEPGQFESFFKVWTPAEWFLFDDAGDLIAAGPHGFGKVPVVVHHNIRSRKFEMVGVSAIADIADININLFNLASLIDEYSYDAAFPILFLEMREEEKAMINEWGLNRAMGVPPNASIQPGFISPPSDPYRFLLEWMRFQIREIHRVAMLDNEPRRIDAIDRRSGVKTELDLELQNSRLSKKAANLQDTEHAITNLALTGLNKNPDDIMFDIKYNRRFDFKVLAQEFEELLQLNNLFGESETLVLEKKKQILRKIIQDPTLRLNIEKELKGRIETVLQMSTNKDNMQDDSGQEDPDSEDEEK